MSVYVDPLVIWGGDDAPRCFRNKPSCHMYADTLEELHDMAMKIGMQLSWFQDRRHLPHYDLVPTKRIKAIKLGAKETDRQHLYEYMKRSRENGN